MSAVDGKGFTFHAQDCSPYLLRVDRQGVSTQVPVGLWFKASGPGVVAGPVCKRRISAAEHARGKITSACVCVE